MFGEFVTMPPNSTGKSAPVFAFRMLALNDGIQHAKDFLPIDVGIGGSLEPGPCGIDDGEREGKTELSWRKIMAAWAV